MSRDLAAATQTASESGQGSDLAPAPVWLVKLEFDDGDVTLCTHDGNVAWNGDTYIGAGAIGSIGAMEENIELARATLQMQLRGLPTDIVAIVLGEHYQGRRATTYLGYIDRTTGQLVGDPTILHRGRMDNAQIKQGKTCSVTMNVESRFADWNRAKVRRYNDADQKAKYPDDKGLEFVDQAVAGTIWGVRNP